MSKDEWQEIERSVEAARERRLIPFQDAIEKLIASNAKLVNGWGIMDDSARSRVA